MSLARFMAIIPAAGLGFGGLVNLFHQPRLAARGAVFVHNALVDGMIQRTDGAADSVPTRSIAAGGHAMGLFDGGSTLERVRIFWRRLRAEDRMRLIAELVFATHPPEITLP